MSEWRILLKQLVTQSSTSLFPLLAYQVAPPSGSVWSENTLMCATLVDFYALCDGGYLGDYNWPSLAELPTLNSRWFEQLRSYYPDGSSPLEHERHLVFATDSGGAPVIWDQVSGHVATFWFKGGDWEPLDQTVEAFLESLFHPTDTSSLWFQAVQQLRSLSA